MTRIFNDGSMQYEIVLVNLDPTIGSEIRKTRPCVVLSPDVMNRHLNTAIIAPMTTRVKNYPTRVSTTLQNEKGSIVLDQIRTIDQRRIIRVLGNVSKKEINQIKRVISEMLVD